MRKLSRLPVLTAIFGIFLLTTAMVRKQQHIIFFGDSITEQGVSPNGYVSVIGKALDPAKFKVTGAGIGGNKVYDLYLRLEDDVLQKKPDLVFIYVGINDVWHKQLLKTGTDYDKYLRFYQALIKKIQQAGSKVVLCTPSVVGEKKGGVNELDADLDKYSDGIRNLAAQNNVPLCDLRKAFAEYEIANNPEDKEKGVLTTDRVHLNDAGNKLVADTMLPFIQ